MGNNSAICVTAISFGLLYVIFIKIKKNKLIVLYFIKNQILIIDENISKQIIYRSQKTNTKYHHFFYPEIKNFLDSEELKIMEQEINEENPDYFNDIEIKRKIGENELYICELIRSDLVEEFIAYVNRNSIYIETTIKSSIFETNPLLMKNEPSLIEYAAFYGSIQIFQYLNLNQSKLNPSLWIYAIHSQNPELIHILEENNVEPPNEIYLTCFDECIKCHHNDIANYIYDQFLNNESFYNNKSIYQFYNIQYLPNEINDNMIFYYLCRYDYFNLIELYLESVKKNKYNSIQEAACVNDVSAIYILLLQSNIKKISSVFENIISLEQIAIPKNVEIIGEKSFSKCTSLKQISIPSSVKSIGNKAFYKCIKLTKISIPSSVTSFGNGIFSECSSLTQISIPLSVTSIGDNTFYYCSTLKRISIPSTVTSIGNKAFFNCLSLTNISIPSSVKSIGNEAFYNCIRLTEISIENGISSQRSSVTQISNPLSGTSIGDYAFCYCSLLTQISIPSSVTKIGNNSFKGCSSLIKVELPSSLISIEHDTFNNCSSLIQVELPSSLISIDHDAFNDCSSLIQIELPSSLISIDHDAFNGCSSLTQVTIPSSVKKIGDHAFQGCSSLTQVSMPSSVKSMGYHVFERCHLLDDLCCSDSENDYLESDFDDVTYNICGAFILLPTLLSLIALFIVTVVWWSRIHPWFAHGYKSGKIVYISLEVSWINSLIIIIYSVIFMIFLHIFRKIRRNSRKKIYKMHRIYDISILISLIIYLFLYFISIVSAIVPSIYSFKYSKIEGKSVKCLKYIMQGYQGAKNWVTNQSFKKQNDLQNWYSKMMNKAYTKNGKVTNYYCIDVGIPTFIFALLPIPLLIYISTFLKEFIEHLIRKRR